MRPVLKSPFTGNFSLDSSGVAGFFGGEEAFAAMNSVHLIPSRRWLGWYNSPGSYFVAKKYGTLPRSTFWDGLFPGPALEPAELLEIDAKKPGPRYTGVYSGTRHFKTGHLCYLLARYCKYYKVGDVKTSITSPKGKIPVTIVRFPEEQEILKDPQGWAEDLEIPSSSFPHLSLWGKIGITVTILASISFSILSALFGDWYAFGLILFGAVANGISLLILGSGVLRIDLTQPEATVPPGDGILFDETSIIILLGPERTISTILRSRYQLKFESERFTRIGFCCLLLLLQFLLQLLLIPQGQLIGQVLFLLTLAVSWVCNGYLASKDLEDIQTDILFSIVGKPTLYKFNIQRWTKAVAFTIFFLSQKKAIPDGIIDELLPNKTPAWNLWKQCVCRAMRERTKPSNINWQTIRDHGEPSPIYELLSSQEQTFIEGIINAANEAYNTVSGVNSTFSNMVAQQSSAGP